MVILRRPWTWVDPTTGKKYKFWGTPDIVRLLTDVIEEQEQAESFFKEYEKVAPPGLAEHNLAYHIDLIRDPDIRDDAADLFMINFKEHDNGLGGISPEQVFFNKNGGSSLGLKIDSSELPRKAIRFKPKTKN